MLLVLLRHSLGLPLPRVEHLLPCLTQPVRLLPLPCLSLGLVDRYMTTMHAT